MKKVRMNQETQDWIQVCLLIYLIVTCLCKVYVKKDKSFSIAGKMKQLKYFIFINSSNFKSHNVTKAPHTKIDKRDKSIDNRDPCGYLG